MPKKIEEIETVETIEKPNWARVLVCLVALLATPALAEDPPSNRELYDLYREQQQQIDATADAVEGAGREAASGRTRLGGYGELHFNFLAGSSGAGNDSEADFHRFVLFVEHEFTDTIKLVSELEVEHAFSGSGGPGAVELEQAFIEFDLGRDLTGTAGLFLVPVGILNETHEPPTFYGVERNPVETNIIPSTWWEAGGMLGRKFDNGISTQLAVTTGLQAGSEFVIRSGRQKVAEADASGVAVTGRLVYRGYPGLELAASVQWSEDIASGGKNVPATLIETHLVYQAGPLGLRALYARWDLHANAPEDVGADAQYGFYVEPSYRAASWLGVFARYNQTNTRAGNSGGRKRQVDVGFNFWPHENVVLKIDGQFQHNENGAPELDGVNLGLGFDF